MLKHVLRKRFLVLALAGILCTLIMEACRSEQTSGKNKLKITESSKSKYVILVDAKGTKTAKYAAKELQKYVKKITGAELPIVSEAGSHQKIIFVGPSPYAEKMGVNASELPPEGFLIEVKNDNVFIIGKDTAGNPLVNPGAAVPTETGTLFGVCEFLERFLDVHWMMPGELGEVLPEGKNELQLPSAFSYTSAPFFKYRLIHQPVTPYGHEGVLWRKHNRIGSSISLYTGHSFKRYMPVSKYFKEHPEYFAMLDGKRSNKFNGKHWGQVCTSNPEVINIFVREAEKYFKQNPGCTSFPVVPNDGTGFCECPECRALDPSPVRYTGRGTRIITDRILTFVNTIAGRIAKNYPGKYILTYAYSSYRDLPLKVKPAKNVYIMLYLNSIAWGYWNPELQKKYVDFLKGWAKITENNGVSAFYTSCGQYYHFPTVNTKLDSVLFKLFKELNYKSVYITSNSGIKNWGANGLDTYIIARLMWDPEQDLEKLFNLYCDKFYGPAAENMKTYYRTIEKSTIKWVSKSGSTRNLMKNLENVFTPKVLAVCSDNLKTALKKAAKNEKYLKRIKTVEAAFNKVLKNFDVPQISNPGFEGQYTAYRKDEKIMTAPKWIAFHLKSDEGDEAYADTEAPFEGKAAQHVKAEGSGKGIAFRPFQAYRKNMNYELSFAAKVKSGRLIIRWGMSNDKGKREIHILTVNAKENGGKWKNYSMKAANGSALVRPLVYFVSGTRGLNEFTIDNAQIQAQSAPELQVPPASSTPQIDGDGSDKAWENAALIKGLKQRFSNKNAPHETDIKLTYDPENMYIMYICREKDMSKIKGRKGKNDEYVSGNQNLEIFIENPEDKKTVYQFVVNDAGTKYDAKIANGKRDKEWNGKWKSAIKKYNDRWVTEIIIPFEDIGLPKGTKVTDKKFRANFYHINPLLNKSPDSADRYGCWSPVYGLFSNTEKFGTIIFEEP